MSKIRCDYEETGYLISFIFELFEYLWIFELFEYLNIWVGVFKLHERKWTFINVRESKKVKMSVQRSWMCMNVQKYRLYMTDKVQN